MKFLGQAKKFFKVLATEPEPKAQFFNVRCASGHRVRGERTEGYQALRCPACGEGVFVLPRSPLPVPIAPERPPAAHHTRTSEAMVPDWPVELSEPRGASVDLGGDEANRCDTEIVWDDELPEPSPSPKKPDPAITSSGSVDLGVAGPPQGLKDAARRAASHSPAKEGTDRRQRQASSRRASPPSVPSERGRDQTEADARPSRRRKPLAPGPTAVYGGDGDADPVLEIKPINRRRLLNRFLILLVPIMVIATIAWRYREHLRQQYPAIIEKGLKEGMAALEEGDFDKAHQLLSAAKSAVDGLGGDVHDATEIRKAADEASLFVNLITQDLGDLLSEAGRTDPETWASRFDSLYKGRAVVIDSIITAVPDGTSSSAYELLLRILPPGEANTRDGRPERVGVIDLTGFQLFELAGPAVGTRVPFGARLASFKYESASGLWVVRLEPKSGVFIEHSKALDSFGWRDQMLPEPSATAEDQP